VDVERAESGQVEEALRQKAAVRCGDAQVGLQVGEGSEEGFVLGIRRREQIQTLLLC